MPLAGRSRLHQCFVRGQFASSSFWKMGKAHHGPCTLTSRTVRNSLLFKSPSLPSLWHLIRQLLSSVSLVGIPLLWMGSLWRCSVHCRLLLLAVNPSLSFLYLELSSISISCYSASVAIALNIHLDCFNQCLQWFFFYKCTLKVWILCFLVF